MTGRDSVKDIITKSFIELLKEKCIDDISINALADYAKVGKTSRWLDSSDTNYLTVSSPQAYVVFLLEHLYKYRDVIDLMMRDNRMYLLEAEFDKRFRAILTDVADPWHIAFTIGGFYKLFCYWAETGYEKTPQEIAEYVK